MTIGLVLSNFDYTYRAEDGNAECPSGFTRTSSNRANWEVQFPTATARKEHLSRCGHLVNRGPNCENVWLNPDVVRDSLPFQEVMGKVAYGANLDGVQDGSATITTCAHEEFISPAGEPGIDNQYYRFLGCTKGVRAWSDDIPKLIHMSLVYRLVLVIDGVDDERYDEAVEVGMYRGRDPLIVDAAGKAVPWQSQRIDDGPRKLIFRTRGRIVDGVLLTEPTDVLWDELFWEQRLLIRGMSLRLRLTPIGAEGLRLGYVDAEQLWQSYSQQGMVDGTMWGASGPAAYAALHRLADGYKDTQSGTCTALSSARKFEFVRAHVIDSKESNP